MAETEEISQNPNQKLYEFTQVFGHALKLMVTANQLPEFVLSKARDINAQQTLEILSQFEDDMDILRELALKNSDSKVSNDIDFETKKMLYEYIEKAQIAVDAVSSPHYKLMLDRYIAAAHLAGKLKLVLENLLKAEEGIKEARLEQED
jgi:hypothetical protein